MIALTITFVMAVGAALLFILSEHKKEIWESIEFKEGDTNERK